jgi:hypothetical protein
MYGSRAGHSGCRIRRRVSVNANRLLRVLLEDAGSGTGGRSPLSGDAGDAARLARAALPGAWPVPPPQPQGLIVEEP